MFSKCSLVEKSKKKVRKEINFELEKVKGNIYEFVFNDNLERGNYAIILSINREL